MMSEPAGPARSRRDLNELTATIAKVASKVVECFLDSIQALFEAGSAAARSAAFQSATG